MFSNLSIKARNILLAIVVMVGLGTIHFTATIFNNQEKNLLLLRADVAQIQEHVLELRKHEKDFFARNDVKYEAEFHKAVLELQKHTNDIITDAKKQDIATTEFQKLNEIVQNYANTFAEIVAQKKRLGLTPEEGFEGSLRKSVHDAEKVFKEFKDYQMQTLMLTLRRNEKDFMLRSSMKYFDEHTANYQKAVAYIQNHEELAFTAKLMDSYRQSFAEYVKASEVLGLDTKSGLQGKLRSTVHQTEELITMAIKNMDIEIEKHIATSKIINYILGGCISAIILSLIFLIIRSVLVPLHILTRAIVSNDRDLTMVYTTPYNDELKEIADSLNDFMGRLRKTVLGAINASDENAAVAHQLSTTSNSIGKRAEEESSIVVQTTQTGNEAKKQIDESVESSKRAKEEIAQTNKALIEANKIFELLIAKIEQTAHVESNLQQKMDALSQDAEKVKGVLNVINDIADQTNLLALNAAIEAARAGEHGRGFAVVADEVRQLAERTQRSLVEINATVSVIVQAITDSGSQMDENAKLFGELVKQSEAVSHKIDSSVVLMENSLKVVESAAEASEKSGLGIKKAMEEIHHINEITTNNARDLEEIAAAAEHLHEVTQKLNDQLHYFKV